MRKLRTVFAAILLLLASNSAFSQSAIEDSNSVSAQTTTISGFIIRGNQRISTEIIQGLLPFKTGDEMPNKEDSKVIYRDLWETGHFDEITIIRQVANIVITVVERP